MLAYTLVSILGLGKEKLFSRWVLYCTVRSSCLAVLGYWVALLHWRACVHFVTVLVLILPYWKEPWNIVRFPLSLTCLVVSFCQRMGVKQQSCLESHWHWRGTKKRQWQPAGQLGFRQCSLQPPRFKAAVLRHQLQCYMEASWNNRKFCVGYKTPGRQANFCVPPVIVFALHRNSLHKVITIPQQWLCVCVSSVANVRFWEFPLPNTGWLCQGEYWLCWYCDV